METESKSKNKITTVIGIILLAILTGLMIYVFQGQNDVYENLTKTSDMLVASSTDQAVLYQNFRDLYRHSEAEVALLNTELQSTQNTLEATEGLLAQAREMNAAFQDQLAAVGQTSLSNTIQQLKAGQSRAIKELADLSEILKDYRAAEVDSPQKAKAMIKLFKAKLRVVKTRLNDLKRAANLARIAAQKEEDRIAFLAGNRGTLAQGFLVKDGELTKTASKEQISQGKKVNTAAAKKINIDVQFLEE